jgi:hypothetical protein
MCGYPLRYYIRCSKCWPFAATHLFRRRILDSLTRSSWPGRFLIAPNVATMLSHNSSTSYIYIYIYIYNLLIVRHENWVGREWEASGVCDFCHPCDLILCCQCEVGWLLVYHMTNCVPLQVIQHCYDSKRWEIFGSEGDVLAASRQVPWKQTAVPIYSVAKQSWCKGGTAVFSRRLWCPL